MLQELAWKYIKRFKFWNPWYWKWTILFFICTFYVILKIMKKKIRIYIKFSI